MTRKFLTLALCFFTFAGVLYPLQILAADNPLVMSIFPRRNAKATIKFFKPMASYLSEQLGRQVKLVTSKNFAEFWKGVQQQKYDIVHYNQYHYLISHKKFGYKVILKNEEFGEDTIAGSIIVRKDSGFESVKDLTGKKIVFGGGPKAMQSYIVATYLLQQGGLNKGDYIEAFAKNPPNAIFSAYFQQADAAGSGDKVLYLSVVTKRTDPAELKYLVRGEQLTHLPWAVKGAMSADLRLKIQNLLFNLTNSESGKEILTKAKLTGLQKAIDSEFDEHRKIVKSVYNEDY